MKPIMTKPRCSTCGKIRECSAVVCPLRLAPTAVPKDYRNNSPISLAGGGYRTEPTNKE